MFVMEKDMNSLPTWEKLVMICIITFSLTSLYAVFHGTIKSEVTVGDRSDFGESKIVEVDGLVTRREWGAQPPISRYTLRDTPPPYVIISHTATNFCCTRVECIKNVREIQDLHVIERQWHDIAYNFLVGGDGSIYEGRGWDVTGAHTKDHNHHSIGIAFIGRFAKTSPTLGQLQAAKRLIQAGFKAGKISRDYKLLGHRQLVMTESPGEVLFDIIKTWDHWSPTP